MGLFCRTPHVIILGAGLSGLSAAYFLKQHGIPYTILEARDRLGGRVDTRRLDNNLTIEMGGEWIGQSHKRMQQLCQEFGLPLVNHHLNMALILKEKYHPAGRWHFTKAYPEKLKKIITKTRKEKKYAFHQLDHIDMWHYLSHHHITPKDLNILDMIETTNYGEGLRAVSAYDVLSAYFNGDETDRADFYRIEGGNSRLPEVLANSVGLHTIHLKHPVTGIYQSASETTVVCRNGTTWRGDVVICTLPAHAVTRIFFDPALPEDQYNCLDSLDYCKITKCAVVFSKRFWDNDAFEAVTDTPTQYLYHATQGQKGTKGAIMSYTTSDNAQKLSYYDDKDIVDAVCATLKVAFGEQQRQVQSVLQYAWGNDPYTRGAYALYRNDQDASFRTQISRPFLMVHFAGEHLATDHQGYMEGAVESGQSTAKKIVEQSP